MVWLGGVAQIEAFRAVVMAMAMVMMLVVVSVGLVFLIGHCPGAISTASTWSRAAAARFRGLTFEGLWQALVKFDRAALAVE